MKMVNKFCALMLSVALCAGMAAPAFAYGGEPVEEVEQPVLTSTTDEENVVTVTDEETGALTPEGNLTLVDDYHTDYSDGSGQQFITLVSKSGATFYLVIDRNAKGQQTVHFMNLVDEADLLALIQKLKPIIRSAAAYAPPEVVDGKPPVYPYTPIKSDFEDAETVEEMMLYTELQSAVHAMIQRLEYSFTFNPSLLTSPKRKKQVAEILTEAEKYIWRIKEEMRCA